MNVMEVVNPRALEEEAFAEVVKEMVKQSHGQYTELPTEWFTDPNVVINMAYQDDSIHGCMVMFLQDPPQVSMIYSTRPSARRALVQKGVEILKDKGYTRVWAVNATKKADSVWKRALWREGKAEKIGSILEFEL